MTELRERDLIIENWYHSVKWDKPVQLTATDIYDLVANSDGANISSYISDMFTPIPLSEEWLVKFGYKRVNDLGNGTKVFEHRGKRYLYLRGDVVSVAGCSHVEVKHIHTLQNLIHSLTGADLVLKE